MRRLAYPTFLCLAIALAAAGCSPFDERVAVSDPSKPTDITLTAAKSGIVSLNVQAVGSIQGTAEISLMLDGKPYKTETVSGRVSFRWGGDWYSPKAEIRYRPMKVEGGSLELQYRFGTI